MIGSSLHHYRIVEALGSGGMGEVYVAEDTRLHRRIALKVLPAEMVSDPARLQRFQREAQAVAALNHPNVVTIYSVEECDGTHFLTMELVEGKTLEGIIPAGGFDLPAILKIALPLIDAVAAAHERGIVHRDLKPANVMVANDGRLKVLDFGVAKVERSMQTGDITSRSTELRTAENRIVGTVHYMSPEQAEGGAVDHRSDIFSLGVVLYEMATGRRPFRGNSAMAILSSIIKDSPPPLSDIKPGVPDELARIVARCLAKEPSRRYQSAADLRNDLEELQQQNAPASRLSAGRRHSMRWIAAIAIVAALTAAAAVFLWRPRQEGSAAPHMTFSQVTAAPGVEWFPSLSPDGKWIVYGGDGAGNRDIYLQSVSGQTPINLTKDSSADDDQPAFSHDGERIAFRSSREGGGLFVMGRTGEAVTKLSSAGFNPAWSPDGTQIAYATEKMELNPQNAQGRSQLWTVSINGGTALLLTPGDAVQPAWSPHNRRIAFARRLRGLIGRCDIWTIPAAGGTPTPLVTGPAVDWNPVWSPDGKSLYFSSDRDGSMNIWRIAVDEEAGVARADPEPLRTPAPFAAHMSVSSDGQRVAYSSVLVSANIQRLSLDPSTRAAKGEPEWLTTGSRSWSSPDPSPDREWIAFYSRLNPEGDLYVIRADGTGLRQLTGDVALDRVPRWSPDGKWIVAFSDRSGILELWKIRPDGSDLQQLTSSGNLGYPVWSPDGSQIAVSGVSMNAYIFDANRSAKEQKPLILPQFPGPQRFMLNSWSPDGAQLAAQAGESGAGVLTYSLRAHKFERLTDFGEWPVWFPDSRHILFVTGGKNFYEVDSRTRKVRKIFSVTRDVIGPPRLTKDGSAAYFSRRVTESDIWVMTLR